MRHSLYSVGCRLQDSAGLLGLQRDDANIAVHPWRTKMRINGFIARFFVMFALLGVANYFWGSLAVAKDGLAADRGHKLSTVEDFLALSVRPIAIGHHGVAPNEGADPSLPLENTVESVRLAYTLGCACG